MERSPLAFTGFYFLRAPEMTANFVIDNSLFEAEQANEFCPYSVLAESRDSVLK